MINKRIVFASMLFVFAASASAWWGNGHDGGDFGMSGSARSYGYGNRYGNRYGYGYGNRYGNGNGSYYDYGFGDDCHYYGFGGYCSPLVPDGQNRLPLKK